MSALRNDDVFGVTAQLCELALLFSACSNRIVSRKNDERHTRWPGKVEHFARALWKISEVPGLREKGFGLSPVRAHSHQQFRRQFCDFSNDPIYNLRGLSSEAAEDRLSSSRPTADRKTDAEPDDTYATQNCTNPRKKDSADKHSSLVACWLRIFIGMKCINQHYAGNFVRILRGVGAHNESTEGMAHQYIWRFDPSRIQHEMEFLCQASRSTLRSAAITPAEACAIVTADARKIRGL